MSCKDSNRPCECGIGTIFHCELCSAGPDRLEGEAGELVATVKAWEMRHKVACQEIAALKAETDRLYRQLLMIAITCRETQAAAPHVTGIIMRVIEGHHDATPAGGAE